MDQVCTVMLHSFSALVSVLWVTVIFPERKAKQKQAKQQQQQHQDSAVPSPSLFPSVSP